MKASRVPRKLAIEVFEDMIETLNVAAMQAHQTECRSTEGN